MILGVVVGAVVLPGLSRLIDRRDLLRMMLPVALAVGLVVAVTPRTNRIFYDEHIYQNAGQNLAALKLAPAWPFVIGYAGMSLLFLSAEWTTEEGGES